MSASPAIVCADLHAEPAWHGLNLVVQPGECAVVAGNGRGKFRLLQLLLGERSWSCCSCWSWIWY